MPTLLGLEIWQIHDLILNQIEDDGTVWSVTEREGWAGTTGSTLALQKKPRQHGDWRGRGYAAGRHVSVSGKVRVNDPALMQEKADWLNDAVRVDGCRLSVTEVGVERWADVAREDMVVFTRVSSGLAEWSFQVASEDWRKFAGSLTDSTALPSTFGGLIIGGGADGSTATAFTPEQFSSMANRQGYTTNTSGTSGSMELYNADGSRSDAASLAVVADATDAFTIPFTIDAVTVTGQVSLVNPGNETGPVRLRIDGPCRGPVVTHVSSGAQLVFSSSLVLGVGEWIDVDMEARTVLANGQATRAPWITSRGWSGFTPGENTWAFTAAAFDADARLTVVATPSWK